MGQGAEDMDSRWARETSGNDWRKVDRLIVAEQQGGGRVKPLDLSILLRDAFLSGRGLKDGDRLSEKDVEAWVNYDPERVAAYRRIADALYGPS